MKATFTAADESKPGHFRALVSAYDVKYRIGWSLHHTIEMGAFADSIAEQAAIPIYHQHSWSWSELPPIGHGVPVESAEDGGLVVEGEYYLDDSEMARVCWRASLAGALREWSIGYGVMEVRRDPQDDQHEFVTKAELLEASSVLRGANPETNTLEVASRPGLHRITTASGVLIETADAELVARLTETDPAPAVDAHASTAPIPDTDRSGLLAHSRVREMFGDALVGTTNPNRR